MNRSFVDALGYVPEDLPTTDALWERVVPDPEYRRWAQDAWAQSMDQARRSGRSVEPRELRVIGRDGSERTLMASGIPVDDSLLATFFDITEIRQLDAQLAHYHHHLEELVAERTAQLRPGSKRVLHVGDSMVEGVGVSPNETFVAELGRLAPGVDQINAGFASTSDNAAPRLSQVPAAMAVSSCRAKR